MQWVIQNCALFIQAFLMSVQKWTHSSYSILFPMVWNHHTHSLSQHNLCFSLRHTFESFTVCQSHQTRLEECHARNTSRHTRTQTHMCAPTRSSHTWWVIARTCRRATILFSSSHVGNGRCMLCLVKLCCTLWAKSVFVCMESPVWPNEGTRLRYF